MHFNKVETIIVEIKLENTIKITPNISFVEILFVMSLYDSNG